MVEAQHLVSTRKLVDTDAEQVLLEQLIDGVKPPLPEATPPGLHYLLLTPFRYPPLPFGSRFGRSTEPGIWYGSDAVETALAESAYYRLVFLEGTAADLGTVRTDITAYQARLEAERGVDLTAPPFDEHEAAISSRAEYDAAQALGAAMRANGVQAFRYRSARDPERGSNVGAFTAEVFRGARPRNLEPWHCTSASDGVEFRKLDYFTRVVVRFDADAFQVDGSLPTPPS
ncbi:RES family NAD+ phosphorylase [Gaopeijia maritima]|uniref:RES family NAD+ phosphorylase n=1 Tax=Gaopeijia maritima TaxID=3119007 RepID=UPI0032472ECE